MENKNTDEVYAVESVNSRLRSMNIPNKVSFEKALYPAIERIVRKWTRAIRGWGGKYMKS